MMRTLCLLLVAGCAAGMGPSTAATRPLLGQTMRNEDAKMWVVAADQAHVPYGLVRIEQVSDGFARVFNWISITSATRMGSATPTIAGVEQKARSVVELDLSMTVRIPLPVGTIALGGGHAWSIEDTAELSGWGVRASVAPIGQLSIDLARSWGTGQLEMVGAPAVALSGTRTSLGATLLLWGYNQFRFGVAAAKAWTDAGTYTSSGYTYQLVSTMY